eukprot:6966197-Prymnesium_polylepis.1
MQAKHDERELVELIKSAGERRRLIGKILVAWRDVALRAGPGRRESLRALGEELMADEHDDGLSFLAGVAMLEAEAEAGARGGAVSRWKTIGAAAALHWRMALLVRRWHMRRARRWEALELGPQ